jgi:hypothetical protein
MAFADMVRKINICYEFIAIIILILHRALRLSASAETYAYKRRPVDFGIEISRLTVSISGTIPALAKMRVTLAPTVVFDSIFKKAQSKF